VLTGTVTNDGVPQSLLAMVGQSWPATIDSSGDGRAMPAWNGPAVAKACAVQVVHAVSHARPICAICE
jgi:hypothetical protein